VRYADDFVVLCRSVWQVKEAGRRIGIILERLKLKLHPEKTRTVNLSHGTEGFDFLGCHLRKRMSGRILKAEGKKKYFLQRWPSSRSMKRVRAKATRPRSFAPSTGTPKSAFDSFWSVVVKGDPRPRCVHGGPEIGSTSRASIGWTEPCSIRLRAGCVRKVFRKPCAGNRHARFGEGRLGTGREIETAPAAYSIRRKRFRLPPTVLVGGPCLEIVDAQACAPEGRACWSVAGVGTRAFALAGS
jgi:hypothetical protein